jgi:phage terminase large subunit
MKIKTKLRVSKKLFNDIYQDFVFSDIRTQIFFGGSSSGKSVFLAQRCVLDVAGGDRNYLITRKVARTIRSSTFNEIQKAIRRFKLTDKFNINKSDMVITCVNGYQILFGGLDDVEKIKSITPQKGVITDIWVEEATEADRADIKQLEKRLRGISRVAKRLVLSFNPILQTHWIYTEYFGGWDDSKNLYRDENLSILRTTFRDNKFLTNDDRNALENETDPYYKAVYSDGKWGVLGAVIFKNWRVEDCSEIRKTADKFKNGLDFGFAEDPAAFIHTYYDKTRKTIYILDEIYQQELTNKELAEQIKAIVGKNQFVTCDSAEPKSIRELLNYSIRAIGAKKGPDSVDFGIKWLQSQTIVIDVKCQNAKNEFSQYKWKEDKNNAVLPVPVDKFNHLIDALRYAYEDEMRYSVYKVGAKPAGF